MDSRDEPQPPVKPYDSGEQSSQSAAAPILCELTADYQRLDSHSVPRHSRWLVVLGCLCKLIAG